MPALPLRTLQPTLRIGARYALAAAGLAGLLVAVTALAPRPYAPYTTQSTLSGALLDRPGYAARHGSAAQIRPEIRGQGPVLVLTDPANRFTDALCLEVLPTEGLPSCAALDTQALTPAIPLKPYQVIIATDRAPISSKQAQRLGAWVRDGGHLMAIRPADTVARLLGLGPSDGTVRSGHLRIDTTRAPGAGLSAQTLQFHGDADQRAVSGARTVAQLLSARTAVTSYPAVTERAVGAGTASAYAFDPVRSIFLTRNGDPALSAETTVSTDGRNRMMDRFGQGFLDAARADVPQADELMHLLTNQIEATAALPRLWYLPTWKAATNPGGFLPAAVILTGDDHASDSQTLARFRSLTAQSPAGCDPAEWTCLTATSYAFPDAFSDAAAKPFTDRGFEVAPHFAEGDDCPGRYLSQRATIALTQDNLGAWAASYPSIAAAHPPITVRWHCYGIWNDYAGLADVDRTDGIIADLNSACWPQSAFDFARCLITGTALPMSYADQTGRLTGVAQFTTQATDENPATSSAAALDALLTAATGPEEYYGYYTLLAHLDNLPESNAMEQAAVSLARRLDLPVISTLQAATFWAERAITQITAITTTDSSTTFALAGPARTLELMIPVGPGGRSITSITRDGVSLPQPVVRVVNGVKYALIPAATSGSYVVSYR